MFNPTTNRFDSIVAYLAFVNQYNKSIEGLGLKVYGTIEDYLLSMTNCSFTYGICVRTLPDDYNGSKNK
jgi:hypothetical protein